MEIELRDPLAPSPGDAHRHIERHVSETVQELSHRWISGCEVDLDRSSSQATFLVVVDAGEQQRAVSQGLGVIFYCPARPRRCRCDCTVPLLRRRRAAGQAPELPGCSAGKEITADGGRLRLAETVWTRPMLVGRQRIERWCTTPVALRGKHGAVHRL